MAVAFDNVLTIAANATGVALSYTTSGTGIFLYILAYAVSGQSVTGITYNGVSMTQIASVADGYNTANTCVVFGLMNAASGANNIVCNFTGGGNMNVWGGSYNGVATTGQPRIYGSTNPTSANNFTVPLTTVNGEWVVAVARTTANYTAYNSNTTLRGSATNTGLVDSGGATPGGSYTVGVNCTTTAGGTVIAITLAPPAAAASSNAPFFLKMVTQ